MTSVALHERHGLPDALRVLLTKYPREIWERDPGLDGLLRFRLDRHHDIDDLLNIFSGNRQRPAEYPRQKARDAQCCGSV